MLPLLLLVPLVAWPARAAAQPRDPAAAEAVFERARQAMERGETKRACDLFAESNRLDPAPGALFNLANCFEKLGKLASAWEAFRSVSESLPGDDERRAIAAERTRALAPRVPHLTIHVDADAPAGTRVVRDGIAVGAATLGLPLPVDPGQHVVIVKALGHRDGRVEVTLREGDAKDIDAAPGDALESGAPAPAPATARSEAPEVAPQADRGAALPAATADHALGAVLRGDIDGKGRGAVVSAGPSYRIARAVDVALVACIGRDKGLEPSATVLLTSGALRPLIALGVPVFFVDGPRPGVRAAAGVAFEPASTLSLFAEAGASYFASMPGGYDKLVFVPSIGVEGRL